MPGEACRGCGSEARLQVLVFAHVACQSGVGPGLHPVPPQTTPRAIHLMILSMGASVRRFVSVRVRGEYEAPRREARERERKMPIMLLLHLPTRGYGHRMGSLEDLCGFVFDVNGAPLRISERRLVCILQKGHEGPHECEYLARITIANTGPTFDARKLRAREDGLGWCA